MSYDVEDSLQARAIEWLVRLRHADEATWDAFAQWLAEDPRHGVAYDAIEQTDLAIEPLLPQVVFRTAVNQEHQPANVGSSRFRRWGLFGAALAASIAAVIVFAPQFAAKRYEVVTGPGQHQIVTLDATTRVTLNGSTHMTFDRNDPRFASLVSGEALFRVHHDSARPFRLYVGDGHVEDVGTVFNVVRDAGEVRVAVAEGKIVYNAKKNTVPLVAGQALVDQSASGTVRLIPAPIAYVGAWQNGRLVYSGEPLSQVAADLGRSLGVHIVVSPSIANRPFSGAIVLNGTGPTELTRLKLVLNVGLESGADGWTMTPVDDGAR